MELFEAIRQGATMRKQCVGNYFRINRPLDGGMASCALGAALDAVGKGKLHWDSDYTQGELVEAFPEMASDATDCPVCGLGRRPSFPPECEWSWFTLTAHLNDEHKWSREAIADYLEVHTSAAEIAKAA